MCLFEHTVNDVFRILLVEGVVTNFALEEGDEIACRLLGVESECILAFCCKSRVESEQMPVTALNSLLLFDLSNPQATLDTVVDARSIADYDGRTMVSFPWIPEQHIHNRSS